MDATVGQCDAVLLGDSGMMVVRPPREPHTAWQVRYTWHDAREEEGQEQQHYFNCPYQLGTLGGSEVNTPSDALKAS